jgi:hypothetical protein
MARQRYGTAINALRQLAAMRFSFAVAILLDDS